MGILKTIIANMFSGLAEGNWLVKILIIILMWINPALELLLLLFGIVAIDYILDCVNIYRRSSPNEPIKHLIWEESKTFVLKIVMYSVLAVVMNGLQLHLFKDVFSVYRWFMAVPIIGESLGVIRTIEGILKIKLVDGFLSLIKTTFKKEGVDPEFIDKIEQKS